MTREIISKTNERLLKVAAVVGAITIIAGGYTWYINNVWRPKVEVTSVDFDAGKATFIYRGKEINIEGDAMYWLNGDWAVRLGNIREKDQKTYYDRIELLKKGYVVEYLKNN